jgi:hypothetical protein
MARYFDIDTDVRINGGLTVSSASIFNDNLTLSGSGVLALPGMTNVKSAIDAKVPLAGGTMTGQLRLNLASAHLQFAENSVNKWHIESTAGSLKIVETGIASRLTFAVGGAATFANAVSIAGGLTLSTGNIALSAANATVDGVDVSAHNHSGANQGGTVAYSSLSGTPTSSTWTHDSLSGVNYATATTSGHVKIGTNISVVSGVISVHDPVTLGTNSGLTLSTQVLSVDFGSTANKVAMGDKTVAVTAGTNMSGGGTITIGAGGTVTLNTVNNPTFSTSVTTPLLTNAGNIDISATGTNSIDFLTNGTQKMIITSGGSIGIGTTVPGQRFEVKSGNVITPNSTTS